MSDSTTTLLNNAVSYDWEELKKLSRGAAVQASVTRSPVQPTPVAPAPTVSAPATVRAEFSPTSIESLAAKLTAEVSAHLLEELDLVVELALKKTRAHLRSDLERTIALNVERAVRESLKAKLHA